MPDIQLQAWSAMTVPSGLAFESDERVTWDLGGISVAVVYKVPFYGQFSSFALAAGAPALTPSLPIPGTYLPNGSSTIYVSNVSIELAPDATPNPDHSKGETSIALYKITYSPITAERLDLPPISRPAQISGGGIDLTEVRRVDVSGKPIVNAAGDYYEGLPNFYIPGSEFQVTINLATNPSTIVQQYSFSQNSAVWNGVPIGAGMMGKISFRKVIEKYALTDVTYYPTTFPFRVRSDANGWNFAPLNYGYRFLNASSAPAAFVDPSGVHGPCFLDSSGKLLNGNGSALPTAPSIYPPASGGGLPGYQVLSQQAWASLPIPNPFTL